MEKNCYTCTWCKKQLSLLDYLGKGYSFLCKNVYSSKYKQQLYEDTLEVGCEKHHEAKGKGVH